LCDLQQKNDVSVNLLNGPTMYSYRSTVGNGNIAQT